MTELVATVVLAGACAWTSYVVSARVLPVAPASVRWCAAAVVAFWLLIATFLVLATLSLFRASVAIPLWAAIAVALHFRRGQGGIAAQMLRADLERAGHVLRCWRDTPFGLPLLVAAACLVALRCLRSLLAPPLAWDALTYHLLRAARWVQTGRLTPEPAPDAWGYYEYFQPFGDILWAWAMLPVRGDFLVGAAGIVVWLVCVVGGYAAARALNAAVVPSGLAALGIGFSPAVFNYVTAAHVDNLVLALFLLTVVFLKRALDKGQLRDFLFAAAGLGVLGGVKFTGVPLAAIGVALMVVALVIHRPATRRATLTTCAGCAVALSILCQPYLRAWWDTGSPTYPFSVEIAGTTVFAGNAQLKSVLAHREASDQTIAEALLVPDRFDLTVARQQFLNPGPSAVLVLVLGLFGVVPALRQRNTTLITTYMLLSSIVIVAGVTTNDTAALRSVWLPVFGRFLIVPLAAATLLAANAPKRLAVPLLVAGLIVNMALTIPLGWGPSDMAAFRDVLWLLIPAAIVATAIMTPHWKRLAVGCAAIVAVLSWIAVRQARDSHRDGYFREAAHERTYDTHRLHQLPMSGFPLWDYFDGPQGRSIAVSAGWSFFGHNWFQYPLLGRQLQNRVTYVPITSDGAIVNYREADQISHRADYDAWVRRLVDARIDYFVLLPPDPPEAEWVHSHPEIFRQVAVGRDGLARAFYVNRTGVYAP